MARFTIFLILMLACLGAEAAQAAIRAGLRGEAALSLTTSNVEPRSLHAALRYVPELKLAATLGGTRAITALGSLDATWQSRIYSLENTTSEEEVEVYRLWLRYDDGPFEARVGRQRITFGPSVLLRPLMWFDNIDPRDPLQITEGVDAALARYYLLNNANFWVWGIRGSGETKGWELVPTAEESTEYGGRLQWPLGSGEVAFSYHHRQADFSSLIPPAAPTTLSRQAPEDRYALDAKWDILVGLWFEAVLVHQHHDVLPRPYRQLASVGLDYTFGIGQGLTALAEHLVLGSGEQPLEPDDPSEYSAFSLRYRWGVVDEFSMIVFSDWDARQLYNFLEWRRTYDRWSLHLMVFANPQESQPSPFFPGSDLLAGTGLRALVVFNH